MLIMEILTKRHPIINMDKIMQVLKVKGIKLIRVSTLWHQHLYRLCPSPLIIHKWCRSLSLFIITLILLPCIIQLTSKWLCNSKWQWLQICTITEHKIKSFNMKTRLSHNSLHKWCIISQYLNPYRKSITKDKLTWMQAKSLEWTLALTMIKGLIWSCKYSTL